jgi:hypothetical protein
MHQLFECMMIHGLINPKLSFMSFCPTSFDKLSHSLQASRDVAELLKTASSCLCECTKLASILFQLATKLHRVMLPGRIR